MKRKAFGALCLVIVLVLTSAVADAAEGIWKGEKDHNRWTRAMIFGNEAYDSYCNPNCKEKLILLEDAVLICLDEYSANRASYQDKLNALKEEGVPDLPSDISDIDFTGNSRHRKYTHKGWYHDYGPLEIKDNSNPELRKEILRNVVKHVFPFNKNAYTSEQADQLCDAMCCLLYCTHLVADRYHSDRYYGNEIMLLLADDSSAETIIGDLLKCLPVLMVEDRNSELPILIRQLQRLEDQIITERRENPSDLLNVDCEYAEKLKKLLGQYVPELLYEQAWFNEVFPSNWNSSIY